MLWTALGLLQLLLALLLNEWTLRSFVSLDGVLQPSTRILIGLFDLALVVWGSVTIALRKRPWVRNLNVSLLSLAFLGPLAAEVSLRAMIALKNPAFLKPGLYADYTHEDLYWQMEYHWTDRWEPSAPDRVHPLLGWSQDRVTGDNPLGLEEESRAKLAPNGRPKLLFYGDSFVKGGSSPEYQIPRYLDDRTPLADVVDLGMGGFGTDQALLMFESTVDVAGGKPVIVMGLLNEDLDRALLTMRTSQKPYFLPAGERGLELRGLPIERDQKAYYEARPPKTWSYFYRWVARFRSDPAKRKQIREINARLMDRLQEACRARDLPLVYVVFYGRSELEKPTWRERFIKEQLEERGLPYVDTKQVLLNYARREGTPLAAFYRADDPHHNDLGNRVIGDAVLDLLRTRQLVENP